MYTQCSPYPTGCNARLNWSETGELKLLRFKLWCGGCDSHQARNLDLTICARCWGGLLAARLLPSRTVNFNDILTSHVRGAICMSRELIRQRITIEQVLAAATAQEPYETDLATLTRTLEMLASHPPTAEDTCTCVPGMTVDLAIEVLQALVDEGHIKQDGTGYIPLIKKRDAAPTSVQLP